MEIIGEVITMILKALRAYYPPEHPDMSIERWLKLVGVQHVWVGQVAVARILIRVRPGMQHMAIVDGLHGRCLPWDKEGLQLIYFNYPLCICFDCQRFRRHASGYACLDCCSTGHLAGDVNCPHFQRRLAQLAARRAAREAAAPVEQVSSALEPSATGETTAQQTPSTKRAAVSQLGPEQAGSSDAASFEALAEEHLRELAAMEEEKAAAQAMPAKVPDEQEWQLAGRGAGKGRGGPGNAGLGVGGGRGVGKGRKGKRGEDVIAWLCAFCNTPTGPTTEHQRKYCERTFRPPPVHEVSRARCAFCDHGHLFTECPILTERGGLSWLPNCYLAMCEFQGYPTVRVGERKMIRIQNILPLAPALPPAPSSMVGFFSDAGGSHSSSQGSESTTVSLTSANELSLASTNPDIQQLVSFVSQQHTRLSEQIVSLTETVKKMAEGQEAMGAMGAATVKAVADLRVSVRDQLAENKRETEASMARTLEQCKEAMKLLGQAPSSGDMGVSGPPGAQTRT
jgi:hypothetical protein